MAGSGRKAGVFVKPVDFIGKSGQKRGSRSFPLNPLIFSGKPVNLGVVDPLLFFSAKRREKENICACVGRLGFGWTGLVFGWAGLVRMAALTGLYVRPYRFIFIPVCVIERNRFTHGGRCVRPLWSFFRPTWSVF